VHGLHHNGSVKCKYQFPTKNDVLGHYYCRSAVASKGHDIPRLPRCNRVGHR